MGNNYVSTLGKPTFAGLDISTGHAIDSYFATNGPKDPWAVSCTTTFIDAVINHYDVLYPLPSKVAVNKLQDILLPNIFVQGEKQKLIKPQKDISADVISLSSKQFKSEYKYFSEWARGNSVTLVGWLKFHRETPRIFSSHSIHVPKHLVNDFWKSRRNKSLAKFTGISDDDLNYAFDVFVRTIQYHKVLGENTPYFAHPIRERAFGFLPALALYQDQWSWGRYFVQLLESEEKYKNVEWLLEKLVSVRLASLKHNANWYSIGEFSKSKQIDLLETIASESSLPAKIKESVKKRMEISLGVGGVISTPLPPIVSIILELGVIAVEFWNGDLPGSLGKIPVLRGLITWPSLFKDKKMDNKWVG